jgi:uncharacterized protein (UPF0147 family)
MYSNDSDEYDFMNDDSEPLDVAIMELKDMSRDPLLQKNVKAKIEECIRIIGNEGQELSIRVNKVAVILDDICDDTNMETFCRTRLYNISQLLEKVN